MESRMSAPVKLDQILASRLHEIKLKQLIRYSRREERVYESRQRPEHDTKSNNNNWKNITRGL